MKENQIPVTAHVRSFPKTTTTCTNGFAHTGSSSNLQPVKTMPEKLPKSCQNGVTPHVCALLLGLLERRAGDPSSSPGKERSHSPSTAYPVLLDGGAVVTQGNAGGVGPELGQAQDGQVLVVQAVVVGDHLLHLLHHRQDPWLPLVRAVGCEERERRPSCARGDAGPPGPRRGLPGAPTPADGGQASTGPPPRP